jgi:hypothetical protein
VHDTGLTRVRFDARLVRVLCVAITLLVAGFPWPPIRRGFATAYAAVSDGLLSALTFGRGGRVRVLAGDRAPDGRKPEGDVSSDAILMMTIDRQRGSAVIGINARRDAYLPLLLLSAIIAAAPLSQRSRLRLLLLGGLVQGGVILVSLFIFVAWNFAIGLSVPSVFPLSDFGRRALDLTFRTLLLPPGNRFIVPLFVAGMLIWFDRAAETRARTITAASD